MGGPDEMVPVEGLDTSQSVLSMEGSIILFVLLLHLVHLATKLSARHVGSGEKCLCWERRCLFHEMVKAVER